MTDERYFTTGSERFDALIDRFQPVFDRIRSGAIERESERSLPIQEIEELRESGFGRLRVPTEFGGFGVSIAELAALLIELGAADSNLPQALRGHIGFTEYVLAHPDPEYRRIWFERLVDGALVGNAESERTGTFGNLSTTVRKTDDGWRLSGTKYYTTGSLYADWILVSAALDNADEPEPVRAVVQVSTRAPGVTVLDDWDGFGQRLTGSGTTEFVDVEVDARFVHPQRAEDAGRTILHAVYQLVHLATLAGIAQAALAEITTFVQGRTRNLFNLTIAPTEDPVALQIIGETYGAAETVKASVLAAAATVDGASTRQLAGQVTDADFARAEAHVYGVQATVIDLVLRLASRIFEVGGASATAESRRLDRLWRNARTVASHNPAIYRQQAVGDYVVNGVAPSARTGAVLSAREKSVAPAE
ncbi:alkylation response protein AidB-like acyl-CoA dehydrogenase [Okibacterium sp. HSC-33S16]|uniref:acyl-CoA dehydrogenase family protein n=1 Tax=Okibacterium sp. HSC-33S16 TaxID=2910965 RepID=UPI00209D4445|nr:acyl-CoA dehydrogenase family protein [Okibacterium sp. HSC-33S16]MCP2032351.1 alkylation response protein AidB-like acyl-CoA dehydrogenase [Okibacterium sp. HSC-33S16]